MLIDINRFYEARRYYGDLLKNEIMKTFYKAKMRVRLLQRILKV
jgi:hypothetical protein